jgi:phosphoserine phosphatase RsbU/P
VVVPAAIFEPSRLEAVRATRLLDTPAEVAFDRLADMAGTLLDAPYALVTLVDENRSFWKSCIGIGPDGPRQNAVEESFCQYVVGSGEKLIVGDTRADPRTRDNPSIEAMGVLAWAGYPVFGAKGEVLGTFCVVDTRTRDWTDRDERVLEALSEAASREIALRTLARSLQASLLPPSLPAVPGIDIAARYAPAGDGTEVVGDFYDVFALGEDCWGVVIGDVCGKGVEAAKVTAMARHTIRAAARADPDPAKVLGLLNETMAGAGLPESLFLSAQFGLLRTEGTGARLRLSSAGHPMPILRRADGGVEEVQVRGTLLGLVDDPPLAPIDLELAPGDTLLLYTDGVTEARGGDVFGERRLLDLVRDAPAGVAAIADHVETAIRAHTAGPLSDDIALLVVQPQLSR